MFEEMSVASGYVQLMKTPQMYGYEVTLKT